MLSGGHQPCAGIARHAVSGPLLERSDQGILGELFGNADVSDDVGEAGDQARGFDPPDGLNGPVCVGSQWLPILARLLSQSAAWVATFSVAGCFASLERGSSPRSG